VAYPQFDRIHSPLAASQMPPDVPLSVTISAWIGLRDWQISRVRVPCPLTVVAQETSGCVMDTTVCENSSK